MLTGVRNGIGQFKAYKADAAHSGRTVPGMTAVGQAISGYQASTTTEMQGLKGWHTKKLTADDRANLAEMWSISDGVVGAPGEKGAAPPDSVFEIAFSPPQHRYVMTMVATDQGAAKLDVLKMAIQQSMGKNYEDAKKFVAAQALSRLFVTVNISYSNRFGAPWNYTKGLAIGGLTLDAGIQAGVGIDTLLAPIKGMFAEGAKPSGGFAGLKAAWGMGDGVWGGVKSLGSGIWDLGKGKVTGEGAKQGVREGLAPTGGIEFGFLPQEITKILTIKKEGIVSDPAGRFWGPPDLAGPVAYLGFIHGEAQTPIGTATYHGIDGLRFVGGNGWSTTLDFAALGTLNSEEKGAAAAKLSLKIVEGGAGVATNL